MIQLSGPRCLAMSVVGTLFGWWMSVDDVAIMAHYRSLSHDALLLELAKKNDGSLSTSIMGSLFVIAGIVIAVDVLTRFFEVLWKRLERSDASGSHDTPASAA